MNCPVPRRARLLVAAFAFALLIVPFSSARAQQQTEKSEGLSIGSTLSTIVDLGSDALSSAARVVGDDPYSEFRETRYSNDGLLSERDEIKLGQKIHVEAAKKYELTNEGQERANRIGQRVARVSLRPNLTYRFYIIRSKEINAFSGPGGYIYVTTALMDLANDEELASVLAHEVGHVVARHSLKTLEQSQSLGGIAELFGSLTGIAGEDAQQLGTAAASIVAGGLLAVHNREEEREADYLGVHTMAKAGYNPEGMISMFQKLQRISHSSESSLLGSLFSDHPDVQERIDNTRYEISRIRGARRR